LKGVVSLTTWAVAGSGVHAAGWFVGADGLVQPRYWKDSARTDLSLANASNANGQAYAVSDD
jgi:hypothetical protein